MQIEITKKRRHRRQQQQQQKQTMNKLRNKN